MFLFEDKQDWGDEDKLRWERRKRKKNKPVKKRKNRLPAYSRSERRKNKDIYYEY